MKGVHGSQLLLRSVRTVNYNCRPNQCGCIGHVCNPLSVAEGKKLRLVIDLTHVNSFLVRFKFKYEDLRSLSQVLEEGHWFFTWDLKSGYHHVDICLEHQMYLCSGQLQQKRVKAFTDNQGAARILSVGSSKVHLQSMSIFDFCLSNGITLEAQWIPRSQNERADLLSRFVDKDDWCVNPSVFRLLDAKWGAHTFDRFATYYNAQLPRFNSKFVSPGCSGVDALAQDWSSENNWICPPVSLIVDSVRHLMSCSGCGTLIIPEWPCAHVWPFLRDGSSRFSSFVTEVFVLPAVGDLLLEGPGQKQIYKSRPSVFRGRPLRMLALRLDFR